VLAVLIIITKALVNVTLSQL